VCVFARTNELIIYEEKEKISPRISFTLFNKTSTLQIEGEKEEDEKVRRRCGVCAVVVSRAQTRDALDRVFFVDDDDDGEDDDGVIVVLLDDVVLRSRNNSR
jgi:hypothetical protein